MPPQVELEILPCSGPVRGLAPRCDRCYHRGDFRVRVSQAARSSSPDEHAIVLCRTDALSLADLHHNYGMPIYLSDGVENTRHGLGVLDHQFLQHLHLVENTCWLLLALVEFLRRPHQQTVCHLLYSQMQPQS